MKFKLFKGNGVLAGYADTIQEAMSYCEENKGWYFEKEGKLTKEELIHKVIRLCINKQLERHGYTYNDVKNGAWRENFPNERFVDQRYLFGLIKTKKKITEYIPWYWYLTFESEQEFNEWKAFCINLFIKELGMTKQKAEIEFAWFNLDYGLKQNYDVEI